MINEVYNHKIDTCSSIVIMNHDAQFEICIMDYNAICLRRAMLITGGVFLWEYAPTFDDIKEAITFVESNTSNFV